MAAAPAQRSEAGSQARRGQGSSDTAVPRGCGSGSWCRGRGPPGGVWVAAECRARGGRRRRRRLWVVSGVVDGPPCVCGGVCIVLVSIVVSIPACHAGDRGSIPRRGGMMSFLDTQAARGSLSLPLTPHAQTRTRTRTQSRTVPARASTGARRPQTLLLAAGPATWRQRTRLPAAPTAPSHAKPDRVGLQVCGNARRAPRWA